MDAPIPQTQANLDQPEVSARELQYARELSRRQQQAKQVSQSAMTAQAGARQASAAFPRQPASPVSSQPPAPAATAKNRSTIAKPMALSPLVEAAVREELARMQQSDRQQFRNRSGPAARRDFGGVVPPRVPGEAATDGVNARPTPIALADAVPHGGVGSPPATAEEAVNSGSRPDEAPADRAGGTANASAAQIEAAFQRQFEAEQRLAPARRELEGMGMPRQRGRENDERKIAERATKMTGRLASAAQDANWPFYLVIVLSVFNDVFDIFDLGSLLGLDQVVDSLTFLVMLAARLFIRQGAGWIASKIAAMAVEWLPLVGILPCWTIAAVYVWRRALRLRRVRQGQAARSASAQAAAAQAANEPAEEPGYAEAGASGN